MSKITGKITKEQIKILYAVAASAGLVNNSAGHEDEFHQLVYGMTRKESVKELTYREFIEVKYRIEGLTDCVPSDMITLKQKGKVYAMMKELAKLSPMKDVSVDERLCGIIKKVLKISSFPKEPLRWVKKKEATKLIQIIGFYIENEKKKGDVKNNETG